MLILLTGLSSALAADILINEVLYDADNDLKIDDEDGEWIELCNPTGDEIDLSGWYIESAGTSWSESWTFPEGTTLAPGGYLAFGPGVGGATRFSPALQNGGGTDGVRLVNASGSVIDTVLYDDDNANALLDDLGSTAGPYAPDVTDGHAIARFPDCTEKANTGADFVDVAVLTPGAANPGPVDCSLDSGAAVVINEFLADPAGSDTGDNHWIELYNPGTADADISGWILEGGTTAAGALGDPLPEGTIVPAGGYLVIGGAKVAASLGGPPDVMMEINLGNATSNVDGIVLADCNGDAYDTALYGSTLDKEDGWLDDSGAVPASFAPKPGSGLTTGRVPNGVDTDASGSDFVVLDFPSPWAPNDAEGECDGGDVVKINEFLPNPDSETSAEDATNEWVELYNTSGQAVDLSGWEIQWGTSSYSGSFALPNGTTIPANGFLLIGGESVEGADVIVPADDDLELGTGSSNLDALRLMHCGPGVADTVIYGPSDAKNEELWSDDGGSLAVSYAPEGEAGLTIARRADGVDTDASSEDFVVADVPSPGEPNPQVRCEDGGHAVKINEIFPNPASSDSGYEWVELYNAGSEAVYLDDWILQTGSSSWNDKFSFPPGSVIEPGQYVVIGEEMVPSEAVDYLSDTSLSLGNASDGYDGVRLVSCPGGVEDTLLYGKTDAVPSAEEEPWADDAGNQTFAIFPEDDERSIGRVPDGADTDDNGADFGSNLEPTPGAANAEPEGEEGGEDGGNGPPQKGCGNKTADGEASKCAAAPGLASPLWLVALVALIRRRSR